MGWAETQKPVPQFRVEQCLGRTPFLFLLLRNTGPQSQVPPAAESQCPRSSEGQFPQPPTSVPVQHLRQNTRSLHQSSSRLPSKNPFPHQSTRPFPEPRSTQSPWHSSPHPTSATREAVGWRKLRSPLIFQALQGSPNGCLRISGPAGQATLQPGGPHCHLPPLWFSHPSDTVKRALRLKPDTRGQPQVPL